MCQHLLYLHVHTIKYEIMLKYYNHINWLLWALQLFFIISFFITLVFYFSGGGDLELLISVFLFLCSFHCFMLKRIHQKSYVNAVTDFSMNGAFKNLNRFKRRKMEQYMAKMKTKRKN